MIAEARDHRFTASLEGLAVGDALGQQFLHPAGLERLAQREVPPPRWHYTDDTAMALGIGDVLRECGRIDQDRLAAAFAVRFAAEPQRGYGAGAARLLRSLADGADWRIESKRAFGGQGSWGNGAAMRAAPLGARSVRTSATISPARLTRPNWPQ